jgi:ribonuclease HI
VPSPPVATGRDVVHCDGGSRGNPGPAAIAAVLVAPDGSVTQRRSRRIGRASAGEAEYRAMLLGLSLAAEQELSEIELCSDSQLALAGVVGDGPSEPALASLAHEVREAATTFASVTWTWHPRAENTAADELVRELLWGG